MDGTYTECVVSLAQHFASDAYARVEHETAVSCRALVMYYHPEMLERARITNDAMRAAADMSHLAWERFVIATMCIAGERPSIRSPAETKEMIMANAPMAALYKALEGEFPSFGTIGPWIGFVVMKNVTDGSCVLDFGKEMLFNDLCRKVSSSTPGRGRIRGGCNVKELADLARTHPHSPNLVVHHDGLAVEWDKWDNCDANRCVMPVRRGPNPGPQWIDSWQGTDTVSGIRCAVGFQALLEGNRPLCATELKALSAPCTCTSPPKWPDLCVNVVHGAFHVFCTVCKPAGVKRLHQCIACPSALQQVESGLSDGKYNVVKYKVHKVQNAPDTAVTICDVFKGFRDINDMSRLMLCTSCCAHIGLRPSPPCTMCAVMDEWGYASDHVSRKCRPEKCNRVAVRDANVAAIAKCTTVRGARCPLVLPESTPIQFFTSMTTHFMRPGDSMSAQDTLQTAVHLVGGLESATKLNLCALGPFVLTVANATTLLFHKQANRGPVHEKDLVAVLEHPDGLELRGLNAPAWNKLYLPSVFAAWNKHDPRPASGVRNLRLHYEGMRIQRFARFIVNDSTSSGEIQGLTCARATTSHVLAYRGHDLAPETLEIV